MPIPMLVSRLGPWAAFALAIPVALAACSSDCCRRRSTGPVYSGGGCVRPPGPSVPFDPSAPPPVPTPPPQSGPIAPVPQPAPAAAPAPAPAPAAAAPAADKPSNLFCPVMMGEPVDPTITTVWQGKVIGFCSQDAKAKFLKDPEKYAKNLP